MSQEMHLFWNGPFSQWSESYYTLLGVNFNTAEQAMMFFKAALFQDEDAVLGVMSSPMPNDQKAWGRKVRNFDVVEWEKHAIDLVTCINYAKFTQSSTHIQALLDTKDMEIVEASPVDKIWGIGLAPNNPKALDRANWDGRNWLGICVMNAREIILNPSTENSDNLTCRLANIRSAWDWGINVLIAQGLK